MKPATQILCGSVVMLALSPGFAEPQTLITIDPSLFVPGQNISNATTGATLRSVTFIANPDSNAPPSQAFIPQYSPVFAQTVTSGCSLGLIPCAPTGNSVYSYLASPAPASQPIIWGEANRALECAMGQCFEPPNIFLPILRADFASPTDSVSVMMTNFEFENGEIAAFSSIAAFDDTGQLIGVCFAQVPPHGSGCDGTFIVGPVNAGGDGWVRVTLSAPTTTIRFVLIGGASSDPMLSMLQFDSPVSLQLAGLLTKVQGVGPGKSLAHKVLQAQAFYSVPDIQSTCAMLVGFVDEVNAQNGKHIDALTDAQLLSAATAIETALHCQ